MKVCNKCDKKKPLDQYYKDNRMKDGRRNTCNTCTLKYIREKVCPPSQIEVGKSYQDYLREAGLYDYYKRSLKYQV